MCGVWGRNDNEPEWSRRDPQPYGSHRDLEDTWGV
jgi:hypothetical protein